MFPIKVGVEDRASKSHCKKTIGGDPIWWNR